MTQLMQLQAKECQELLARVEARRGKKGFSPGAIKENTALLIPRFRLLVSGTLRQYISIVFSHQVYVFFFEALGNCKRSVLYHELLCIYL